MRREDVGMLLKLRGQRGAVGHDQKVWSQVPEGAVLGAQAGCSNSMGIGCVSCSLAV